MKTLLIKAVLPLSIIAFCIITKSWHTTPVDARDTYDWGFPFVFVGEGWHTSMSLQLFILEMIADFAVYTLLCGGLVLILHRFMPAVFTSKWLPRSLWILAGLCLIAAVIIVSSSQPVFHLKRPYDWEIIETWIGRFMVSV
ncbi:MAG: hypothetical protein ACK500_14445 [Flavobacteriales bacterium]